MVFEQYHGRYNLSPTSHGKVIVHLLIVGTFFVPFVGDGVVSVGVFKIETHGCFAAATQSRMKKKHSTVITNAIISFSLLGRNQLALLYTFYKFYVHAVTDRSKATMNKSEKR